MRTSGLLAFMRTRPKGQRTGWPLLPISPGRGFLAFAASIFLSAFTRSNADLIIRSSARRTTGSSITSTGTSA